ncbi:hypothetical protein C6503_21040 [Candidatus Poribacteria bacterium]|nr:MAG: hypothetical protein C6503_21040 [Candidatus Poribacteria bacterium]
MALIRFKGEFTMNRLNFIHIICRIGIVVSLVLTAWIPCVAQEETATLSGIVVDTEGKPIPGFTINLSPVFQMSEADENGAFTFTNVPLGPVQIMIPPQQFGENEEPSFNLEPDDELVSIKIGDITLYQGRRPPFGGIRFAVKPGSHFKNIEVTVRPRMRIRARVVFKDQKPLINASISQVIRGGGGSLSGGATTDSEGYFIHYVDNNNEPARYTVAVKYKGLSAKSEPFDIETGGRYDDLVLTLDGESPPPATPTQSKQSKESLPNLLRKLTGGSTPADKPTPNQTAPRAPTRVEVEQGQVKPRVTRTTTTTTNRQTRRPPWEKDAWAVNPANGHAYKKIRCRNLNDAKDRAAAEGAYLVAINDEAEQKWLLGLFGNHLYWIGLSDGEKEGEWVWESGEPLIYTNWGAKHSFPRSTLSPERKNNAVMTFVNGQWHAVGPGDLLWRMTKMAILEKEDVSDHSPTEAE